MKNHFKTSGTILLLGIFVIMNNIVFAQSDRRKPAKVTTKSSTNNLTKSKIKPKYSEEDQAMIKELAITKKAVIQYANTFQTAYEAASTKWERKDILTSLLRVYHEAYKQAETANNTKNNYSEEDKKIITNYKDYYLNGIETLKDRLNKESL